MRLDPDYSVIMFLFQTSFEKRQAMFSSEKIVLPRTVNLRFQKELNGQRALAAAERLLAYRR